MADRFLRDHPELRPFVLSRVQLTGTTIGHGAYGSVEEVAIPVCGAAKKGHDLLLGSSEITTQFAEELQLMSTLRHPNIIQFLGVCFFPGSRLPALVMERLLTSLHDLLDPETDDAHPPAGPRPLSFFKIGLRCSVLHNVASGLAYLHERSPPIIHRDLSAKNVLLTSKLVAKIADLGVARIVGAAATKTKASVYKPPEATAPSTSNAEKSKYDASIDVFSLGVVTIFTLGETFPCDPLAPNTMDEESGVLIARTELQRRSEYMKDVNSQLRACGQLRGDHPLILLIQQCLHDNPHKRPNIREVLSLLEEARAGVGDEESERNKLELIQALQIQPRNQNLECVLQDVVTENAGLQQQLQSSRQQLTRKEAELTREQQHIQEMKQQAAISLREKSELQQQVQHLRQQKTELVQSKDRELAQIQEQLRQQEQSSRREIGDLVRQLRSSEALVADFQRELETLKTKSSVSYTYQVSGPGLQSAIANHPTHVVVELSDSSGRPCSLQQNITAELELISEATPTSLTKKPPTIHAAVSITSPSQYEVSYTARSRGQHKLHVQVNDREINGSPFTMTVYPDPTQLGRPVRFVTELNGPYGIAFNSHGNMIISECDGHQVSVFDIRRQRILTFGSHGDSPEQMKSPKGIATDDADNIYVSSECKLQKFSSNGKLIKCVKNLDDPRGVTLYGNQVYVCDRDNHRIQVFDLDLNFIRSISSRSKGRGEFDAPDDVKFDAAGNMYVAESENARVQVMDSSGHFIRFFGQEAKAKLRGPPALHIVDKYVYVSDHDYSGCCVVVYNTSGNFVTSFGRHGHKEGELSYPYCISSCADGFIYVCDYSNDRVQVF